MALSDPGWADCTSARLSISKGCQDHTTSPYASMPFVLHASLDRSRVLIVLRSQACTTSPRPPHPTPNVRDDREPPLFSGWDGENKSRISEKQKRFIFAARAGQEFADTARR